MKKCFLTLCALLAVSIACQSKDNDPTTTVTTSTTTTTSSTTTPTPLSPNTPLSKTMQYQPTDEIFLNPERGFLTHQDQRSSDWQLNAQWVKEKRNKEGLSLVLTIYYINEFRNRLISEDFLNRIRNNMNAIREGGSKVVLRFAYTDREDQKPWDASWEWTEKHLNQLAPIIRENADIIAVWEAGFVGVWGEWYYTDNYGYQPADDAEAYKLRKKVLDKELSILPKNRMVSVRYPKAKLYTQNISAANTLTPETAFSGSNISRIGFHNDCFLADDDDTGTYHHIAEHRKYVAHETQYVVMGGETCRPASGYSSYAECDNALKDMATYHWSYLNQDYYDGILNLWKNKCMDEVKRRLGYRFVLTEGKFNENISVGGKLLMELKIKNEGFAAPFNPRNVQIVLVKKGSNEKQVFNLNADPRRWEAGKTSTLSAEISLPNSMSAGQYDLYLNLPDPEPKLNNRTEYSIRLANKGVWEAKTGYNKIHSIEIVKN